MTPGEAARRRFEERMVQIEVGATLARRNRHWTVVATQRMEASRLLTLRCGRRTFKVNVALALSGPVLWEVGLRSVALPPSQGQLFRSATKGAG
jgi:hypothetical protein